MGQYTFCDWSLLSQTSEQFIPVLFVQCIVVDCCLRDICKRPAYSFALRNVSQFFDVATASQLSRASNSDRLKLISTKQ